MKTPTIDKSDDLHLGSDSFPGLRETFDEFDRFSLPKRIVENNPIVVLHSRREFYSSNKNIYWYEFANLGKRLQPPRQFLQILDTHYFEYGGSTDEAFQYFRNNKFLIIEGIKI